MVIGIVITVCYCVKEKRREQKEQEERNRQTQYGHNFYDEIAPGQAVDPHNFADENGHGNKILRSSWFENQENVRNTSRSKLSFRERISTFFGRRPKNSENKIKKFAETFAQGG